MDNSLPDQRSVSDKLRAEVVDESTDSYFVEYLDGEFKLEPKTEKNRLLFSDDFDFDPTKSVAITGLDSDGREVTYTADFLFDEYRVEIDGEYVELPPEQNTDALSALYDATTASGYKRTSWDDKFDTFEVSRSVADELGAVFDDIMSRRVRESIIDAFAPRYGADVEVTPSGWIVADEVKVTYEAENYVLADIDAHTVQGNTTRKSDRTHQFLDLSFNTVDRKRVEINGNEYDLTRREQEFLATVNVLINPRKYLGEDLAYKVETLWLPEDDEISEVAETANVRSFMDHKTGLVHGHETTKHVLRATFGVTQELIDALHFSQYDHAGVWELAHRADEFRSADFQVFRDTDNTDSARWNHVKNVTKKAPVPDAVHEYLKQNF